MPPLAIVVFSFAYLIGAAASYMIWEAAHLDGVSRIPLRWWSAPLCLLWLPIAAGCCGGALILLTIDWWRARRSPPAPPAWRERRCPRCHIRLPEA
jgi:hypothetical protein